MSVIPPADRRDHLPLWVILLLVIFAALRVSELVHSPRSHIHSHHLASTVSAPIDDKTMEALLSTNYEAKSAFITVGSLAGGPVAPDTTSLRLALKSAEALQRYTHNAPGAARRVVILRALLKMPPLPGQPTQDAAAIYAQPNIRWWKYPALMALSQEQNHPAQAQRYARQARDRALATMLPLMLMLLFWTGLGLIGVGLLASQAARAFTQRGPQTISEPLANLWPTLPEAVPLPERKLRAGDLMGIFVVYLLMPDLIGFALTPLLPRLRLLPSAQLETLTVGLAFTAYLVSALIPIGLLILLARRRGASIPQELGWNTRGLGQNLLYGFAGYGVGLPLMLLVGYAGSKIHAPAPSNPAIPLLANASSLGVQLMLVGLATIAAPLTEEFLFRGVFYNAAKLRVGVWPAIILTGLIFGFVHPVGISQMLPLAVLGGVFAWMAETRKSLVPSMLGHCLQNLMATLYLLLVLAG